MDQPFWKRTRFKLETGLAKLFFSLFRVLPHRSAQKLGGAAAVLIHDLFHIRRNHAVRELLRAFPDRDEHWARETVRNVYRHFGMVAAETARIPVMLDKIDDWVEVDEQSLIDLREAHEEGKGVFITAGHLGNWEYAGPWSIRQGFATTYVIATQTNDAVGQLVDDSRRAAGIELVVRGGVTATRGILSALKRNHMVAIMIDQDGGKDGVFVPFFGKLASAFRGVGVLAQKTGAAIVMMNSWRDENGRIQLRFRRYRFTPSGDKLKDQETITADLTKQLEAFIREHPAQWLWLHRRWKSRPPEEMAEAENKR